MSKAHRQKLSLVYSSSTVRRSTLQIQNVTPEFQLVLNCYIHDTTACVSACCMYYTGESSVEGHTQDDSNGITEHPHD